MWSPAQVTIDGLVLNTIDDDGVWYVFDTIDGWHDGPGISVAQTQRVASAGQFPQAGHPEGRTITLTGWMYADARPLMFEAVNRLSAVLADGGFGTFSVADESGPTMSTSVQRLERPQIDWDQPLFARFQLQLLSPDPYKYGALVSASTGLFRAPIGSGLKFPLFSPDGFLSFGMHADAGDIYGDVYGEIYGDVGAPPPPSSTGLVTLTNPGNADASVMLEVAGPTPMGGFTITDQGTGRRIIWDGEDLPVGHTVSFDGRTGAVLIDGKANRRPSAIIERWPVVPAGGSLDLLFDRRDGAPTAAVLTASCYPTWT